MNPTIAFFITPHGFGHATRAAAIMTALLDLMPNTRFLVYSTVPRFLFKDIPDENLSFTALQSDVGLVQSTALGLDVPATVAALQGFLPFEKGLLTSLGETLTDEGCQLIVCDISPLGLAVAAQMGLPSILVENFTWDWIYQEFLKQVPAFEPIIRECARLYDLADVRLQVTPVSNPMPRGKTIGPIARPLHRSRKPMRELLEVEPDQKLVLLTMGGFSQQADWLDRIEDYPQYTFILPPGTPQTAAHCRVLPTKDTYYFPDLIAAVDVLVAKLGYGTVAEAYQAGVPFAFVGRDYFRESRALATFVSQHLPSKEYSEMAFLEGEWIADLPELLHASSTKRGRLPGAYQAARHVVALLEAGSQPR